MLGEGEGAQEVRARRYGDRVKVVRRRGRGHGVAGLTSAAKPPVMCTTPEPAKSMTPVRMTWLGLRLGLGLRVQVRVRA